MMSSIVETRLASVAIYVRWEGTPRRHAGYKAVCLSVA